MKRKLLSFLIVLSFAMTASSQQIIHFSEDFNSGMSASNFSPFTIYATPPWKVGVPAINNFTGNGIAHYNDDSAGVNTFGGVNITFLRSGNFDDANYLRSYVEFDYNFYSKIPSDSFYLQVGALTGNVSSSIAFYTSASACGVWNSPSCLNNYPHAKVDITSFQSANNFIAFGYTWGSGSGGYVGIDNVVVYSDTSYLSSNFNSPQDSSFIPTILSGSVNWQYGVPTNSLDNTPMYYFDDDSVGSGSIDNTVALTSEVFDNTISSNSYLEFDYNYDDLSTASDSFYVEVFDGSIWNKVFTRVTDDCGPWNGTACANGYPRASVDLTAFANQNCQVRFIYHDGNDHAGFLALDNIEITPKLSVSLDENRGVQHDISIFPNPNQGEFELRTNSSMIGENYQFMNISGQVVREGRIDQIREQILLSEFKDGVYFLRIPTYGISEKIVLF